MHEIKLYKEMYYPETDGVQARSEGVGNYLNKKYGLVPGHMWFNIYSRNLLLKIGESSMLLVVGTEIPFYTQDNLVVGVGIIENVSGFMKFTPIYTNNQYDKGFKAGDSLFGYIFGFPFAVEPSINYSGGYAQYEIKELVFV